MLMLSIAYAVMQGAQLEISIDGFEALLEMKLPNSRQNKNYFYRIFSKRTGLRTLLSKLMGSAEPIEPMPTRPL